MEDKEAPKVYTLISKDNHLGDKEATVKSVIEKICRPLFEKPVKEAKPENAEEDEDEFDDEDETFLSETEQKIATDVKKTLDAECGGNWNIVIGNRFGVVLNHLPENKWGSFEWASFKMTVFEMNNY
jgi:hypothetical protein